MSDFDSTPILLPWWRQSKKIIPVVVLALLLVPAVILVGIRQLSPKASNAISIQVSPGAIDQSSSPQIGKPVYLSATAVNEIGQPITTGVSYTWGMSSNFPVSPTFKPSNNLASFTPNSTGSGSLWVSAITSESSAIKYLDICVGTPCPIYSDSAPTPTPTGCYYQQVQCVKAPCDPILICPTPTPTFCSNPPSCPNPPAGCGYEGGNCSSCGTLICTTPNEDRTPTGCYYQQVQCVKAPCDPILICPTPTPSAISCKVELFPATASTVSPYSYPPPLDQNLIKVKGGDYYLKAVRVFNNSKQDLGMLTVNTQQLRGAKEPIDIINSDAGCVIDKINKTTSCATPNALGPGGSALASASMVIKVLVPPWGVTNLSTLYSVNSNLGSTQCADMLYYGSEVPPPTPPTSPLPTPTSTPTPIPDYTPTITTTYLVSARVGDIYNVPVEGQDLDANDILSMTIANLPPGLVPGVCTQPVTPTSPHKIVCSINGSPTQSGTYQVSIVLTDNHGQKDSKTIPLTISPLPTPTPTPTPISNTPPTIATQILPVGFVGRVYSTSVTATDPNLSNNLTASVTGLPPLLSLTGCTQFVTSVHNLVCTISGTPNRYGTYPIRITVTDSANASTTKVINLYIFKKYILF